MGIKRGAFEGTPVFRQPAIRGLLLEGLNCKTSLIDSGLRLLDDSLCLFSIVAEHEGPSDKTDNQTNNERYHKGLELSVTEYQ